MPFILHCPNHTRWLISWDSAEAEINYHPTSPLGPPPPTPSPADRMPLPAPIPQVARTITNLQQQIQQHQRQLAQALLVKPPPPPPLSLHPSAGKSALDSFPPHPQTPGLPELQTKEQQSSPSTFAPYPLGESGACTHHTPF